MERLERTKIKGRYYYYYSEWKWVDGKCRRQWQKYLGTLENIVKAVDGGEAATCAEVFQLGLPMALWKEAERLGIPLTTLEDNPSVDLTIDGADEVAGGFDLIKNPNFRFALPSLAVFLL